ncbi:MAG TPA: xanthine dehydrogenase family protein molybdopterin-binding subunit, partial [Caldimonas sp.]
MARPHGDSPASATLTRRALLEAGALVVGFCLAPAGPARGQSAAASANAPRGLPLDEVDSFLAIRSDGTVVVHSGKVDLGTG